MLLIAGTLKMLLKRCLQAKLVCSAELPYLLLSLIYNLGDKLNRPGQARPQQYGFEGGKNLIQKKESPAFELHH
jgi:hypothetical protein